MKKWVRMASRLYPRAWRARYGAEFEALLDDVEPRWSDVLDVLRGALMMQSRNLWSFWKLAAVIAVAGVVAGLAASFVAPKQYVSSALVSAAYTSQVPFETTDDINARWQEAVSRSSLAEIIQRPGLDLYRQRRYRIPMEDVIEEMKRDLRMELIESKGGPMFRISYTYPDRDNAQAVVAALTRKMYAAKFERLHRGAEPVGLSGPDFMVVSPASLPASPAKPDRLVFLAWGLSAGLLTGVLASMLRWRAKWTLKVLAFGAMGCVAVGGLSLLLPNRYTSSATLRVAPLRGQEGARRLMSDSEMRDWLRKKQETLLSDAGLSEIIQRSNLNLYQSAREREPLENILKTMRHDLSVTAKTNAVVTIIFTYSDRFKAQQVVNALVNKLTDSAFLVTDLDLMTARPVAQQHLGQESCIGKTGDAYVACITANVPPYYFGIPDRPPVRKTVLEYIDVLDPASLPESPVAPDRRVLAAAGLVVGLFLGAYRLRSMALISA